MQFYFAVLYPSGLWLCQFQLWAHISSMPYWASQPSSRLALAGVAPALGNVAGAARVDDVGNLFAAGLAEGVDDVQHAVARGRCPGCR